VGGHSQNARLHSAITSSLAHYFGNATILGLYSPPKYPHLGEGKIILCNMISKYTKKIPTCFLQPQICVQLSQLSTTTTTTTCQCWRVMEFSPGYELTYQADYLITFELVLEFFIHN